MRIRRRKIDRSRADRVLDALAGDPSSDPDPLARLLGSSRVPAHESELAGEEAAVAAFRDAVRPAHGPASAGASRRASPLVRLLTLKAAVVAAVTVAGGVALAAGVGPLSSPPPPEQRPATRPPASRATSSVPERPSGDPSDARPPAPAAVGLCRAYKAAVRSDPGKARRGTAFEALARRAGGGERIPGYCDQLLKEVAGGHGKGSPNARKGRGHPGGPDDRPGKARRSDERPDERADGRPGKVRRPSPSPSPGPRSGADAPRRATEDAAPDGRNNAGGRAGSDRPSPSDAAPG